MINPNDVKLIKDFLSHLEKEGKSRKEVEN